MSTESQTRRAGLPHAVFLQRVTGEPATSPDVRLGQGAFLTLRFVDLLAPNREPPAADVFRYQWAATERYCAELAGEGTEAAHLSGIVRAAGEAQRSNDVGLVAPALLAYALYLEQESQFEEAEDALRTLIDVAGKQLASSYATAGWLRIGRVRRLQSDFAGATAAYQQAGQIASAADDAPSVLLSRVGQCNVLYFQGNLPEAEREWRAVLADAQKGEDRTAEAYAEHGLGTVLQRRGQAHAGAPHLWRAYQSYNDESAQLRVLNDLGSLLLSLGDLDAAERALSEVVRRDRVGENRTNSLIELMQCASFRRDRLGFERWREQCLENLDSMIPNVRADFYLKAGIGLARFGNIAKATTNLTHALEIATAHELHELVFRIERIKDGLRECADVEQIAGAPAEPVKWSQALREVSASLSSFGT